MGLFRTVKRTNVSLLFGICFGMVLTLLQTPLIDENCHHDLEQHLPILDKEPHSLRILKSHNGSPSKVGLSNKDIFNSNRVENKIKTKSDEHFVRPQFHSIELGLKDKVLVSVLSSMDSIGTFGVALNETVRHFVDKLLFFIDGTGDHKFNIHLPIVGFMDSKPHLTIFRVLSYIGENFLSNYDFFFFITDHSYIHGSRLMDVLQHMMISEKIHMGSLSADLASNFCSLDDGIILSRGMLRDIFLQLKWCAKHVKSPIPDNKFGECILYSTNTACSSSFNSLTYKSYRIQAAVDIQSHLEMVGGNTLIKEAITFSGLQNSEDIYKIHLFYLQGRVNSIMQKIQGIQKDLEKTHLHDHPAKQNMTWPYGSIYPDSPPSRFDVIRWDAFNSTHIFLPNDFQNVKKITGPDLFDIMSVVNASISFLRSRLADPIIFQEIDYGYRRFDPTRGMDYLFSLKIQNGVDGRIFSKRIKGFRGLTTAELIPMPYVTEKKHVTLLLFVTEGDVRESVEFMERVEKLKGVRHLTLLFTLITQREISNLDSHDPFKRLKKLIKGFTDTNDKDQKKATYNSFHVEGERPHTIALLDLIFRKLDGDSLVVLLDLKAHFGVQFINRVCLNTIKKLQVFSPIPFAMYHPQAVEDAQIYATHSITRKNGHFDKYSYDTISFYVSDYLTARKSYSKDMPSVRSEKELRNFRPKTPSLSLYRIFLTSEMNVIRAVEPELVLGYAKVVCPESRDATEKTRCLQRRALSYGLKERLSKLVIEHDAS